MNNRGILPSKQRAYTKTIKRTHSSIETEEKKVEKKIKK